MTSYGISLFFYACSCVQVTILCESLFSGKGKILIIIQCLLLALGFVMLIKGSDFFVDGAAGIARRFGVPQLVIGLTIVAMGTSAPEAAVSIASASKGSAGIAIGNIVGSNILNIWIILGVTALMVVMAVAKSTIKYEMPFMIAITVLLLILGLDGQIGRIDAIIFLIVFAAYLAYLFRLAKKSGNEEAETESAKKYSVPIAIILTIIGMALIIGGSQVTVNAATSIARSFGVSDRIIGLTIVALGTSLPELFTSINAARKGNADIAIGNIVGSNVFNILFVLGISGIITDIPFAANFRIDTLVAIAASAMLLVFSIKDRKIKKWAGCIFLISYAAYFIYMLAATGGGA